VQRAGQMCHHPAHSFPNQCSAPTSDPPRYWTPAFVERSAEVLSSDDEFQDTAGSFSKTVELRCLNTPVHLPNTILPGRGDAGRDGLVARFRRRASS